MKRELFVSRLQEAARAAREFAGTLVLESLPSELRFRLERNASYDGNPLHPDEMVFPDERALLLNLDEAQVGAALFRDGRVPEWINLSVVGAGASATKIEVLACGRFTANDGLLYHEHEGRPPFHVLGPSLPHDESRDRFSVHRSTEAWSPEDFKAVAGDRVWSLLLVGDAFDDASLDALPQLAAEILELHETRVIGAGLGALERLPRLRVLRLGRFGEAANSFSLRNLPRLASLTHLDVNGIAGATLLQPLADCVPRLVGLGLRGSSSEAVVVPELGHVEEIASSLPLVLPALPSLRSLSLGVIQDDEAIALLRRFPRLESLHLHGSQVGDAFLGAVAAHDTLTFLSVVGTRVSEAGLAELRRARPRLKLLPRKLS